MKITRKAYAKINLCLDVLRKREDGYHELRMIMQTVDIYDVLTFEDKMPDKALPKDKAKVVMEQARMNGETDETTTNDKYFTDGLITFIIEEIPEGADLGDMKKNLIYRAARLVYDKYNIKTHVTITLKKNIPAAAGMAGGSTDAAATFHGLNQLLALGMSNEDMCKMGVMLGADIPYCIMGGTMLSEGIGEILKPLLNPPECYLLIAKPDIAVSTGYVYGNLHLDEIEAHPDVDGMIDALLNHDLTKITHLLGNVLETVTEKEHSIICVIKNTMIENKALGVLMSGSGPTVFGIYENKGDAEAAAKIIRDKNYAKDIFITRPINASNTSNIV